MAQYFAGFVAWTLLDSESFRVTIALRVGADVCILHSCRCVLACPANTVLAASQGIRPMNDVIKRALQKAGLPSVTVLEPPGLDRARGRVMP